jgi:hypothetical protein
VLRRFDLDPRSVRVLYDEHETIMAEDRRQAEAAFGLTPVPTVTSNPEEPHPR